jgi:hypothetical protein
MGVRSMQWFYQSLGNGLTDRIHVGKHLEADLAEKKLILRNAPFFLPFTTVEESKREKI